MARIARGTVVEFTAEIDDHHDWYPLRRDGPNGRWTGVKCWRFSGLSARKATEEPASLDVTKLKISGNLCCN
jgi:hypothetical protein